MRGVWIGVVAGIVALLALAGWGIWTAGKNMTAFIRQADARDRQAAAPWVIKHPAYADLNAASAGAKKAAEDFAALAAGSERTGKAPRQTDPAATALLDAAFDTRLLDGPLPPFAKLHLVNEWLKADLKIGVIYSFAGTGVRSADESASLPPSEKSRTDALADRNLEIYAPEYGRYVDAEMAIVRTEIAMAAREMATPTREGAHPVGGFDKMRDADAELVDWFISLAESSAASVYWRRARMPGLLAMGPGAAQFFNDQQRATLRAKALEAAERVYDRELKAKLTSFADQMGAAPVAATNQMGATAPRP